MDPHFDQNTQSFLLHYGPILEAHRRGCTTGQPAGLPQLIRQASADAWIQQLEGDLVACTTIPRTEWVYGGFLYLPEELMLPMRKKGSKVWEVTSQMWTWVQFKDDLRAVFDFHYGQQNRFMGAFGNILQLRRPGCTNGHPQNLPNLDKSSFSAVWVDRMQEDFLACLVPLVWWARAGVLYLPDGTRRAMSKARELHWHGTGLEWTWAEFIREVQGYLDAEALGRTILKGVAGVALGVVVGPPVIVAGLGALGFGTAGVAAGSAAAAIQSVVYGASTGGLFAICQSIGAAGVGAAGTMISGVIGGILANRGGQ